MWTVRNAEGRGIANFGWLESRHTFSFGDYWDPSQMGFGVLRVINEDRIRGGAGFPRHPHRSMEILSYVLSGALEHKDSMGNGSTIRPGEIQYMSAGTGVTHSEYNALRNEDTHFYQVWLVPESPGGEPRYAQAAIDEVARRGSFALLAGGERFGAPIEIRQNAAVSSARLEAGTHVSQSVAADRQYWLQVARGAVEAQAPGGVGSHLVAGDGLAVADVEGFDLRAEESAELLLFDLPRRS